MPFVDVDNPFIASYFPRWLAAHGSTLGALAEKMPEWAEEGRRMNPHRPLATVFDIDEILLCNLQTPPGDHRIHIADFFVDRETARPWSREDPATPALPGALGLLNAVVSAGVRPVFVTGRAEALRDETIEEFRRAGFVGAAGAPLAFGDLVAGAATSLHMFRPSANRPVRAFKEGVRRGLEKNSQILANVGDQLSDMGGCGGRHILMSHPFYFTG